MKIKKLLLSVCLSISLMFGCLLPCINVHAVGLSDINTYFDVQGKFYQILKNTSDIITTQEHQTSILNKMYDILEDGGYNGAHSGQGLADNGDVTINTNGDVILSVDLQNAIRQATQYEIDNNMGFTYCYSVNGSSYLSTFTDQDKFHAYLDFLSAHDSDFIFQNGGSNPGRMYVIPDTLEFVYSSKTNAVYTATAYKNWSTPVLAEAYAYNSDTKVYERSSANDTNIRNFPCLSEAYSTPITTGSPLVSLNIKQYILYKTYSSMQSGTEGVKEYYVGNDFSTSNVSTTQTITDSMLNSSISYSNIQDYVNSYYVTNNNYPTTNNVYNYINNYDGSGGNGGDNGGGGSDSPSWDFGFLSTIGQFLASLISALGEVVGGVLSAITSIITGLKEGIPNTIGSFLEWFFPFLPSEVVALIELSILCAVIVGLVKLIRGH